MFLKILGLNLDLNYHLAQWILVSCALKEEIKYIEINKNLRHDYHVLCWITLVRAVCFVESRQGTHTSVEKNFQVEQIRWKVQNPREIWISYWRISRKFWKYNLTLRNWTSTCYGLVAQFVSRIYIWNTHYLGSTIYHVLICLLYLLRFSSRTSSEVQKWIGAIYIVFIYIQ